MCIRDSINAEYMGHIDDYETAHACLTDFESPVCKENSISFNFTIDNNETVRNEQHPVSETLFKDLKEIARNGKISMYTIIAICIGIVMASSVFLFVMLIVVIKGKSKVLSVFADIEEEDINRIIGDTNSVSISTKNFNSNLLNKCGNNEEKFWKLLILKKKKQRDKRNNAPVEEKKEEQKIKHQEEEGVSQKSKEKSQFARENEAEIYYLSPINLEKEKERARERRAESRRLILSQIDSSLRNSSICKMLIILIVFLIYGSSSLYINYIIFDFNEVTTTFLYVLSQRNLYGILLSISIGQFLRQKKKEKLYYSCLLYTSPSPRDLSTSRMPSSA
eukprot:TRINITY_DN22963_c0_g2_i1.p1 TRINITY_DN22963_c0_g2~~TRINITY_DN22963_c0_g2_i1.p1  ORF type:complete len:335 (-),score=63.39 TRINITY_DN22963_c0_g2_i1:104-1108(-)